MKALIVDDSGTMRRILSNILKDMGFTEILQAADGVEAVAAAGQEGIDLILMDWNMPNKNGFDALCAIRALGLKMAIVMVTTEAEKTRVIDALKAGANNYIIKPFRAEMVIEKVRATVPACQGGVAS